jgi:hypothetical protein
MEISSIGLGYDNSRLSSSDRASSAGSRRTSAVTSGIACALFLTSAIGRELRFDLVAL